MMAVLMAARPTRVNDEPLELTKTTQVRVSPSFDTTAIIAHTQSWQMAVGGGLATCGVAQR